MPQARKTGHPKLKQHPRLQQVNAHIQQNNEYLN